MTSYVTNHVTYFCDRVTEFDLRHPQFLSNIQSPEFKFISFREEKCLSVWSYDKNISTFWQKRTFKAFGEESSIDEIEEVVEMMDTDCDGKVSFDEFKAFMKREG